jgi:hypothetical protein
MAGSIAFAKEESYSASTKDKTLRVFTIKNQSGAFYHLTKKKGKFQLKKISSLKKFGKNAFLVSRKVILLKKKGESFKLYQVSVNGKIGFVRLGNLHLSKKPYMLSNTYLGKKISPSLHPWSYAYNPNVFPAYHVNQSRRLVSFQSGSASQKKLNDVRIQKKSVLTKASQNTYYALRKAEIYLAPGKTCLFFYIQSADYRTTGWIEKNKLISGEVFKKKVLFESNGKSWKGVNAMVDPLPTDAPNYYYQNPIPVLPSNGKNISSFPLKDYWRFGTPNTTTTLSPLINTTKTSLSFKTGSNLPEWGSKIQLSAGKSISVGSFQQILNFKGDLYLTCQYGIGNALTQNEAGFIMKINRSVVNKIGKSTTSLLSLLSYNRPGARQYLLNGDIQFLMVNDLGHGENLSTDGTNLYYLMKKDSSVKNANAVDVTPQKQMRLVKISTDFKKVHRLPDFYVNQKDGVTSPFVAASKFAFINSHVFYCLYSSNSSSLRYKGYYMLRGEIMDENKPPIIEKFPLTIQNRTGEFVQGMSYDAYSKKLTLVENGTLLRIDVPLLESIRDQILGSTQTGKPTDQSNVKSHPVKNLDTLLPRKVGLENLVLYAKMNKNFELEGMTNDNSRKFLLKAQRGEIMVTK